MRNEVKILAAIAVVVIVGVFVGSKYYRTSVQNEVKPVNATAPAAAAGQLIRPDSPSLGPADAKITLVEFYDPECESCAAFHPAVKKMLKDYEGKIRLVTRYMPFHPNSMTAARFTEAAAERGKYWEAQELLFKKQAEWGERHGAPASAQPADINALFEKYATELGLDPKKMVEAIKAGRFDAKIQQDKKDGQGLGVRRTPTFFVNGRELMRFGESELRALIDEELKR